MRLIKVNDEVFKVDDFQKMKIVEKGLMLSFRGDGYDSSVLIEKGEGDMNIHALIATLSLDDVNFIDANNVIDLNKSMSEVIDDLFKIKELRARRFPLSTIGHIPDGLIPIDDYENSVPVSTVSKMGNNYFVNDNVSFGEDKK